MMGNVARSVCLLLLATMVGCASDDSVLGDAEEDAREARAVGGSGGQGARGTPVDDSAAEGTSPGGASGVGATGATEPSATPGPDVDGTPPSDADEDAAAGTALATQTVDAHNAIRAELQLPGLAWSDSLADLAVDWAETLAEACSFAAISHRPQDRFGENIAVRASSGFSRGEMTVGEAVTGWAAEVQCWEYGPFMNGDACDSSCIAAQNSSGCGHYTQLVWRATTEVGCGYASCVQEGGAFQEIWVCNYSPQGNFIGQLPY